MCIRDRYISVPNSSIHLSISLASNVSPPLPVHPIFATTFHVVHFFLIFAKNHRKCQKAHSGIVSSRQGLGQARTLAHRHTTKKAGVLILRLLPILRFNLPVHRLHTMRFQKSICLTERLASEKSAVCRQRAWMRSFQDQMLRIRQHFLFSLRRTSP